MLSDGDDDHYNPSVRLLEINRNTHHCGFHLTRCKWDPYPWVSGVDLDSAAHNAGMRPGDCLLEVNGEDIVGRRICEVAEKVKASPTVALLLWNAGVDPQCSPEALCCGPIPGNLQKLSACMTSILTVLECPICLDTIAPPAHQCDNGHLICIRCRSKSERCPVCRLRLGRGRSLLADQVYNSIMDAFQLRDEANSVRRARMQKIFKLKNKNVPDIKITQSHTNKFLARLIGKSTSVDNLSRDEFNTDLKAKSLSTIEIFNPVSPVYSRAASLNKLNVKKTTRPASYHGSFESLQIGNNCSPLHHSLLSIPTDSNEDATLYHCPYSLTCPTLIKGSEVIGHFQASHDGPLIQFFTSKVKLPALNLCDEKEQCYIIFNEGNVFFLKVVLDPPVETQVGFYDTLIFMWLMGTKRICDNFQLQINICSADDENVLLSVRSSIYSLSATSSQDVRESKKGIFLSSRTLEAIRFSNSHVNFFINIIKVDAEN